MPDAAAASRPAPLLTPRQNEGGTSYRDEGEGEAVVLIHGVGLNADAWSPQIAALSRNHRVIAIDMMGHGASQAPPAHAILDDYVRQVHLLLQSLGIVKANVIGHSMGGLVALGFALAQPQMTLRLGVLNSVYRRTPEKRAEVLRRASEVAANGTMGNIDDMIARWFGASSNRAEMATLVRRWLSAMEPASYATAYSIFAQSDEAFAGRLHELTMPALFATGSRDPNSLPEMAAAMAREAKRGFCVTLENERHMMNLTIPARVNEMLQDLLAQPAGAVDPRDLRTAFGTFMTGVTVVTTRETNGNLRGFTANSFSSVSLDPPLLLICISKAAASYEVFSTTRRFAVNILAEDQKDISGIFASKRPDKFSGLSWREGPDGAPVIAGVAAWFECLRHEVIDAGDHVILIGRITSYTHNTASPLGYARGGYFTLGLEQSAVNALSQASRAEVGAILECGGRLVVRRSAATGELALPRIGEAGKAGSASQLISHLKSDGVDAQLGFLFAVFENAESRTQSIYYRGTAQLSAASGYATQDFDGLPFDSFGDAAVASMLRRYGDERKQGRFGIYSGDHLHGEIMELNN